MEIKEILDNIIDELNRATDLLSQSMDEGGPEEELVDDIRRDKDRLLAVYDELVNTGAAYIKLDVE